MNSIEPDQDENRMFVSLMKATKYCDYSQEYLSLLARKGRIPAVTKFNPGKLEKLNNPERLKSIPPDYIWKKLNLSECKTIVDIGADLSFSCA